MKTGGEKHDIWKGETHWDCMTPTSKEVVKIAKKNRVKGYKRHARRIAKALTKLFKNQKDPNDVDI